MIKRILAMDGVQVVAKFRDDGEFLEGYGMLDEDGMRQLTTFAHGYKRLTQGNSDQLSMFTRLSQWTPPSGWIVRGAKFTVCSAGNVVCILENEDAASLNDVMQEMVDASRA
ncbi:MAG: DUF2173 family protein [Gammaproteobacteria bacterium]|jgi:roadblock/LC7 domain-containing protein